MPNLLQQAQAADYPQILAETGETVTFRGVEITARVPSLNNRYALQQGGQHIDGAIEVKIPRASVVGLPAVDELIIYSGITYTIFASNFKAGGYWVTVQAAP